MVRLPSGTVTFLLTDVEGSTALWQAGPEAMRIALARHDALFEAAVSEHDGIHIRPRGEGDSRFAVFSSAPSAVSSALGIQRSFAAEAWPTTHPIKVRIGVHTGEAELRDGDYYGSAVNRCARIRSLGHGGQTLLSEATAMLVRGGLPDGAHTQDLGVHRLRDLTLPERIFQVSAPDLPSAFPPLGSLNARLHNLPVHRRPLIGREREIAEVLARLLRPDVGLLTLTGPGGTGKTRLSAQVAAEVAEHFEDGVYFVALAPIDNPELVPTIIAQVLSLPTDGSRPLLESLKQYLEDRRVLLVLDNLEQVLDAAPQFAELLTAARRLKLLVTSRVALRLSDEHTYAVPPLGLPGQADLAGTEDRVAVLGRSEAIRLFVERAQAVQADFALTAANAADVAEVCRRLDGLPLAIELAAARARLLPPSAMLARLSGPTGASALQLLTGGSRDQPARLQTLRNTIAWSYDLLEPEEQALFRRLAIFVGGCTLAAIEAVAKWEMGKEDVRTVSSTWNVHPGASAVLDLVDSLLAKSLLRRTEGVDGEPRYTMLETIREYGLESLALTGELPGLRRWHAEHYLLLAVTAEPLLRGVEQARWLHRLEAEHDNLRAVQEWSLTAEGDADLGLRLCGALGDFWYAHVHTREGRERLGQVLRRCPGRTLARVSALSAAGRLAHIQQDSTVARPLLDEALGIARELGDAWWTAWLLHLSGRVAYFEADAATARSLAKRSLAIARELQDEGLEAWAFHLLGLSAHIENDLVQARQHYEASLCIRRRTGFPEGIGTILHLISNIDHVEGDYAAATSRLREAIPIFREVGFGWGLSTLAACASALAVVAGQPERAARLAGVTQAMTETSGAPPTRIVQSIATPALTAAREQLGDERFAAEQHIGRRMSMDEVVAEALAIEAPEALPDAPAPTARNRAAPVFPDGLSAREVDVLRLMADGRTTEEIGKQLVIQPRTVETHITHVYQKTGCRNRAEATLYAQRHGLI